MNRDKYINWRSKVGLIAGVGVFLAISSFSERPSVEPFLQKLMLPGGLLCEMFGGGRDDLSCVLSLILGNMLFYALLFAALFLMLIPGRQKQ